MKIFSWRLVIIASLIFVLFSIPITSYSVGSIVEYPAVYSFKWDRNPTVQYIILPGDYKTQAGQAIDDVSAALQSASKYKLVKGTASRPLGFTKDGEISINQSYYGNIGWVGYTTVTYSGKRALRAESKLNTASWDANSAAGCMAGKGVDGIQAMVAHELCHALGIGHIRATGNTSNNAHCIMYPNVSHYTNYKIFKVDALTKVSFATLY
jgi:hypothetical protein